MDFWGGLISVFEFHSGYQTFAAHKQHIITALGSCQTKLEQA